MSAPRKSLRPKARPESIYGVGEKSTQSPDGLTIAEREKKARDAKRRKDVFDTRAANRAGRKIESDAKAAPSSRMKSEEKKSDDIFNMMMEAASEVEKKKYGGTMKKVKKMNMGGKCRGMGAATRGGNYKMG